MSEPETITEAAMLYNGKPVSVPRPGRHGDVIRHLSKIAPGEGPFTEDQGFMTSAGRFVDRIEGASIAIAAGQIEQLRWPPELYSEDVW